MTTMVDACAWQSGGLCVRNGVGAAVVLAHLGLLTFLLTTSASPAPPAVATLMVNFMTLSQEEAAQPPTPVNMGKPPILASKHQIDAAPSAPVMAPDPVPMLDALPQALSAPAVSSASPASTAPPMVPPNVRAAYATNPKPAYPLASRRLNESGVSRLHVLVGSDGRVQQIELERSSGFSRLDGAAMSAVRDWKFAPARQGEAAVAAWVLVPVNWSLEN